MPLSLFTITSRRKPIPRKRIANVNRGGRKWEEQPGHRSRDRKLTLYLVLPKVLELICIHQIPSGEYRRGLEGKT